LGYLEKKDLPGRHRLSQTATLPGISTGTFAYNSDDQLSTETYDNNGNTLSTGGSTFTYDFENRLKSMNNGAVTVEYDGDGNRVAKTVGSVSTRYLVDDLNPTGLAQVVDEVANGVVQRTYTYGLQRINENQPVGAAWTASFYGYDGFGTVRSLSNASGTVTDTYDYDAWGNAINVTGSTPNLYFYRGEQHDQDLGLYYLRARYFNPQTGRFLNRDPEAGQIRVPASLHRFLYSKADPVDFADPSGRDFAEKSLLVSLENGGTVRQLIAAGRIVSHVACVTYGAVVAAVYVAGGVTAGIWDDLPHVPEVDIFCALRETLLLLAGI
jgi:RHS repeat-associated protein